MWYEFPSWERDSEDIFALMESWWKDIREEELHIDKGQFFALHNSGSLLSMIARDSGGRLIACFVGIIAPDIYNAGSLRLEQLAACFHKDYRDARQYLVMIDYVEKLCKKFNIARANLGVVNERMVSVLERKGYTYDVANMYKEIK